MKRQNTDRARNSAIYSGKQQGLFGLIAALVITPAAWAHHVMDGQLPQTFGQGLLSGLAHPVIGLDHLAFIIAVGLISMRCNGRFWLPLAFVATTLAGAGIHVLGWSIPLAEVAVAASVVVLGLLLLLRRDLPAAGAALLFAVAGLFHGYAYGESIVGAEQATLAAYLIGFGCIQYVIAVASLLVASRTLATVESRLPLQVGGGVITAVGILFLVQNLT